MEQPPLNVDRRQLQRSARGFNDDDAAFRDMLNPSDREDYFDASATPDLSKPQFFLGSRFDTGARMYELPARQLQARLSIAPVLSLFQVATREL